MSVRSSFTDKLANEIRRVDGNHSAGAGLLAELLMPFIVANFVSRAEVVGLLTVLDVERALIAKGDYSIKMVRARAKTDAAAERCRGEQ